MLAFHEPGMRQCTDFPGIS
ncbi:hypothetical protein [Microcoleus sp. CAWBG58]